MFVVICELVDDIIIVSDVEFVSVMQFFVLCMKVVVELIGCLVVVVVLNGKVDVCGKCVGVIFLGGNVDLQFFVKLVLGVV